MNRHGFETDSHRLDPSTIRTSRDDTDRAVTHAYGTRTTRTGPTPDRSTFGRRVLRWLTKANKRWTAAMTDQGRFYLEHGHHQGCRCRDGSVTITADGVDILPSMPESPTLDADMLQPYLDGRSECGPR